LHINKNTNVITLKNENSAALVVFKVTYYPFELICYFWTLDAEILMKFQRYRKNIPQLLRLATRC